MNASETFTYITVCKSFCSLVHHNHWHSWWPDDFAFLYSRDTIFFFIWMKWATFCRFFYPYNQVPEKGSTMYFGSCLIIKFYHANMLKWLWRYLHADVSAKVTELLSSGNQFPSVLYFQHANICYISCTPQYNEKPHTIFFAGWLQRLAFPGVRSEIFPSTTRNLSSSPSTGKLRYAKRYR